ncbi:hypothetical protein [Paenibacillus bovis]|uniref:Uncharacterized protein n=1 Tax=Paenibacillus bovis TaxID=1616788 RepID=A0A1X9T480_9BACL|nr:hypothetical protein [Paenibacillus bovis]ARR10669.1 hypothetical protein AR543_p0061 [Paenibacillus bovis]
MGKMKTYYFMSGGKRTNSTVKTSDIQEFIEDAYGDILDKVHVDEKKREITINLDLLESIQHLLGRDCK